MMACVSMFSETYSFEKSASMVACTNSEYSEWPEITGSKFKLPVIRVFVVFLTQAVL